MTPVQRLALVLVAMVVAFGAAWQVQAWRYDSQLEHMATERADELNNLSQSALRQQKAEQIKRLALEQQLATSDQQHSQELSNAQRAQARLRDRLATTDLRLSVLLDTTDTASGCNLPATTGAVGVVHGARRAQLDPAHAQRIIGITDTGDRGLIALRACQAYAKEVSTQK